MKKTFVLLATLVLSAASASAVASPGTIGNGGAGGALLGSLLPVLLGGLLAASVAAVGYSAKYVKSKIEVLENVKLEKALMLIADLAFDKVRQLTQEAIAKLKEYSADGTLTPEEMKAAAATAIAEVWSTLPDAIKLMLTQIAGSEVAAQDQYIRPKVEAAVTNQIKSATRIKVDCPPSLSAQDIPALPVGATRKQKADAVKAIVEARKRIGLPAPTELKPN